MYLICNYKNKLTYNLVKTYINEIKDIDFSKINFAVAPSFPFMYNFIDYTLASQDISKFDDIVTGEINGKQLSSILVKYVIIGHYERRKLLHENIDDFLLKINNAHENNIRVIYCLSEDDINISNAKFNLKNEIDKVKAYLNENDIIAYEPSYAIGNSNLLDYEYINSIINYLSEVTDNDIIYGGSVNDANINKFLHNSNIKGFIVSNSALNAKELHKLVEKMS